MTWCEACGEGITLVGDVENIDYCPYCGARLRGHGDVPRPVGRISEVWGDYDDFEEGGWNYAAFVIREDLREMEQAEWKTPTCIREFSDVAINSLRALDELTDLAHPDSAIDHRIGSHETKDPEAIIEEYQEKFERRL